MAISNRQADSTRRKNSWLRRSHRWLGVGLAVFVLFLSGTGIALNHSDTWHLGRQYVSWTWLLDAYGIRAPAPGASFSDRGHYAALIGQRLYFDRREIAADVGQLTGLVVTNELALVTSDKHAFVLTMNGELVERIELSQRLSGVIEKLGRWQNRAVITADTSDYRSDVALTGFEAWSRPHSENVVWSQPTELAEPLLSSLQDQYRGRGLSVERLIADLHSGRFVARMGTLFMDIVALLLIVLSTTGIYLWLRRAARKKADVR